MEENKKLSQEDLRDWFGKGGKGGVGGGGWDRYNTSGNRVGKCGDAKEGEPYSACLSKEKAKKLGKSGIAAFVKRKRDAQKKGGDAKKGGERSKGQKPIKVKTGVNEEVDLLEQVNMLLEKNEPTDPQKWSYATSQAKEKFDIYPCVPMDSQALTKNGWKYYHELKVGDFILAYNQEINKNEWTPILELNFFNDAPIIRLFKKQTNFDIKCTPNHKWVLAKPNSKYPNNLVEAKNITKKMSIKISAELFDTGCNLDLRKFFKKDSWVENILNMSVAQIQSYFASGIVYDGNDKGLTKKEDKQTYGFSQKEKDHGLAMEIAAVLLGYRVCSKIKKGNPSMTRWTFIRRNFEGTQNLHKEDAGLSDVWCPTTKFGTWIMKQNGYITITGNSAYANAWAAKKYKDLGGKWRKKKKTKKKNMKEELNFIREKVKSVILELYSLNELKYDDLTSSEKGSYDNRNTKVLQDKIKPLELQTTKGDVSITPTVKVSPDWVEYKLSEGRDDFFSLSMKNSSEVNIYFTSKLWDFNVDEFNLGISISKFLIDASDYVDFLDESVIKKVERVVNYHLRKKESYINQTIKL